MATFHPKDWHRRSSRLRRMRREMQARDANAAATVEWLLSTGLCLGLTALLPASAMLSALAALLTLAGFAWLGVAIMQAEPPVGSPHLTAWDAALFSLAASFGVQSTAHLAALSP
ncbi:hypothetical protein OPKNFCMD_3292 [Methylobacterium crusticola]|uniref:GGDEF domain-containing protein n=1 Tax=Methylobacterium crusticola TaxID=1697972 RepID=A0ABQ4QZF2_9HYPH|nr:hypothetical protein [Methylobacterium crusticola]GJD50549.1 hypothetical protein OPKNFCMD_3292 [Methylobacterium crusticola]